MLENTTDPSKNNWIRQHSVPAEKDHLATKILQIWQCWCDGATQSTKEFQTIHYIPGFKLCSLESNND